MSSPTSGAPGVRPAAQAAPDTTPGHPALFTPYEIRDVTLRNRVVVSPMCQYSSVDGFANDWHLVHLGSRAVGGAAAVIAEATAVTPEGRISPQDLGIWSDAHIEMLARIASFIESQGSVAAIQLAHAGRKASTFAPWKGHGVVLPQDGGWIPVAPSAIPFRAGDPTPIALDEAGIRHVIDAFAEGARRARIAGFRIIELHAAHGYLLHQFLSPLSNHRDDRYGGSFENRVRLTLETVDAIRGEWPAELPLFVRISATDWAEGGWDLPQSIELCKLLRERDVDLIDCSSGGLVPNARIPVGPLYQTEFAEQIRKEADIPTGAVGLITTAQEAEAIVRDGRADVIILARAMLRDPYWARHAARKLGTRIPWPPQYERAGD